MNHWSAALVGILLCFGCDKPPPQPVAVPVVPQPQPQPAEEPTIPLSEARKGFSTKLLQLESNSDPLPEPPPEIFRIVKFESAIGELQCYLTPDPKDGKKHPAIIWITGGDSSSLDDSLWKDAPSFNDQAARQYREAGIAMMFPTLRGGNGNPGSHEGLYGEVDDVIAAGKFLATQEFVDSNRIYLGGHSSGGGLVLLTAECSTQFRAVFSIGPMNGPRNAAERFKSLFQPFDTANPKEFELRTPSMWLHSIKNPTFIFAGSLLDGAMPAVNEMIRASKNPLVRFELAPKANHFDIVRPLNRIIATKILSDTGPSCNIAFTAEEMRGIP